MVESGKILNFKAIGINNTRTNLMKSTRSEEDIQVIRKVLSVPSVKIQFRLFILWFPSQYFYII